MIHKLAIQDIDRVRLSPDNQYKQQYIDFLIEVNTNIYPKYVKSWNTWMETSRSGLRVNQVLYDHKTNTWLTREIIENN